MREYQGWDEWEEKYKPIENPFRKGDVVFETYGEEYEFVKQQDPRYVWTSISGDMSDLIVAGVAYVNRFAYYVTEVPWENENDYVLISVQEECSCYDEDRADNGGEYGDPECKHCEGYGLVTVWIG